MRSAARRELLTAGNALGLVAVAGAPAEALRGQPATAKSRTRMSAIASRWSRRLDRVRKISATLAGWLLIALIGGSVATAFVFAAGWLEPDSAVEDAGARQVDEMTRPSCAGDACEPEPWSPSVLSYRATGPAVTSRSIGWCRLASGPLMIRS